MSDVEQTIPDSASSGKPAKHATRAAGLEATVEVIQDSRGRDTLRVRLELNEAVGVGDVPAGASKGEDEARTTSVPEAKEAIEKILFPLVRSSGVDFKRHEEVVELDRLLVARAGREFDSIGANAVLPVSRALWQLASSLREMSLAQYLRKFEPDTSSDKRVRLYMNVFNGGVHALQKGEKLGIDRIDIQEIMVVPMNPSSYRDALQIGDRIDGALKDLLVREFGTENVTRGDEAGLTAKGLNDNGRAIGLVIEAIERAGYIPGQEVKIALDVAASSFYDKEAKHYIFNQRIFTSDDMIAFLIEVVEYFNGKVLSIEDGLDENDWQGWEKLSSVMKERGVLTIGDDLFVTQMRRLRRGINNDSAHGVLIKQNQNGSVSGTLDVIKYARENGLKCIISHRSGETLDASIADLAFACGAYGLKSGDPQPEDEFPKEETWVRREKYIRMQTLEESSWFGH